MFKNVGAKIKNLAKVILVLGLLVGIIYLFVSLIRFLGNAEYLEYANIYGGSEYQILTSAGNKAYSGLTGIGYSIMLIVFSIISPWLIYGFGIIVSKFEKEEVAQIYTTQQY